MDNQTKQKINNIINLVRERKALLKELDGLDDYKNKIEKVKQYYGRKTKLPKSRGATVARTDRKKAPRRKGAR